MDGCLFSSYVLPFATGMRIAFCLGLLTAPISRLTVCSVVSPNQEGIKEPQATADNE